MKKITEILTHIKYNPTFSKIDTYLKVNRFINILPLKLKSGIKFAYIKNRIFNFVLVHPIYKEEFKHSLNDIKALLKMAKIENIEEIKLFVTHEIDKKLKIKEENISAIKYQEKSLGIFENRAIDEKIFQRFEDIRKIIKGS